MVKKGGKDEWEREKKDKIKGEGRGKQKVAVYVGLGLSCTIQPYRQTLKVMEKQTHVGGRLAKIQFLKPTLWEAQWSLNPC
jgi:hypothetical protein